jgi:hypothetical protein
VKKKLGAIMGRPKNPRIHELMREHGCSRQWAYVLYRKELRKKKLAK